MVRRRRSCTRLRATTAKESSSLRRRPAASLLTATTCGARSPTDLHGTSMPAFHSLLTASEIEQVIDYVIFLSMRGETESLLIEEGFTSDEKDPNALSDEIVRDIVSNGGLQQVEARPDRKWSIRPARERRRAPRASCRGRDLFLGRTSEKLECAGCHGPLAMGDGPSFVSQDVFNEVVFGGNPSERQARLEAHLASLPAGRGGKAQEPCGMPSPTTGATRFGRPI